MSLAEAAILQVTIAYEAKSGNTNDLCAGVHSAALKALLQYGRAMPLIILESDPQALN